ncbi:MAG: cysteinyl-tRNA synthetase [candidate division Zixibacteria bacterium SM23_73_2]|nr:MAG: cysteinyl-tRNA synthetase [candidate division Zixibacteria bacterium SM23_73_2]
MALRFFNTLTREKEEFAPIVPGKVGMYTCGPTIYDYAHIGNFRTYMFEDLLRRYLEYKGFKVTQVMNITDVDDKTIAGSRAKKISISEYTKEFKDAFFEDLDALNIERAEFYPEATTHIKEMVDLVKKLLDKGFAYRSNGDIYFKLSSFKDYGKLSKMRLENLKVGARVASDEYEKEEASDFALWKGWDQKDGDVFWETEIGKGRPGWHIECSAMSMKYLGEHFDIHTGGIDNMFPHHENEIAQSESATGKKFVNYWLHSLHLIVEGKKMSKSLGNIYTLRDILEKGYNPKMVRYVLLSTHYRQQLNFTFQGLEAAKNAIQRLFDFLDNLKTVKGEKDNPEVFNLLQKAKSKFEDALNDDLNISEGLGVIFDLVRDVNKLIDDEKISKSDALKVEKQMRSFDKVLGVLEKEKLVLDEKLKELVEQREQARKEKDWDKADKIRLEIEKLGMTIEDTPEGPKVKKKL